jgi:hypothetical protein
MGVLDNNVPQQVTPSPEMVANRIRNQTRQTYAMMVGAFNEGSKILWQNPRGIAAEDILNALGTDAREIFELHGKLGQLLSTIKPEDIAEGVSIVGQFAYNEDGTVSIVQPTQG